MVTKNFDNPIHDKGHPILDPTGKPTSQAALLFTLLMGFQGELTPGEKMGMYRLGNKISGGGDIDITLDEIALIKKVIISLPPLSYGQIHDNLESS